MTVGGYAKFACLVDHLPSKAAFSSAVSLSRDLGHVTVCAARLGFLIFPVLLADLLRVRFRASHADHCRNSRRAPWICSGRGLITDEGSSSCACNLFRVGASGAFPSLYIPECSSRQR